MTPYQSFLAELEGYSDPGYRQFHAKIIKEDPSKIIGVRVPVLKKLAKKYREEIDNVLAFPDEFYEVTYIKLSCVSALGYEDFIKRLDSCLGLINNWALCDLFTPNCINDHKDEFLPYIRRYIADDRQFVQRFALVTLLHFYVEEKYLDTIFSLVERCDTSYYYVSMAAAWLIAECLAKYYGNTRSFLLEHSLDKKTHNLAIQKARESYRIANDDKNYLKGIKR